MNDINVISRSFQEIGARVKVTVIPEPDRTKRSVALDVRRDKKGEYFDIRILNTIKLLILDEQPLDRHLLLMARDPKNPKAKFLCGHDEGHWFASAIPENSRVSTVTGAKQALKPKELVQLELTQGVRQKDLHKRRRKLRGGGKIIRQGEFMFIPKPDFEPSLDAVLKNEILARGGNPHRAQYLYREGGTTIYINSKYPNGLNQKQYEKLTNENPKARKWNWRVQVRNPIVHVKGKISHPEHTTVNLGDIWHRVLLNTENKAKASYNVTFID
jgi:hypothetical protein